MKFSKENLCMIDYLIYQIIQYIHKLISSTGIQVPLMPSEYQDLSPNQLEINLQHHRPQINESNIKPDIKNLLLVFEYVKNEFDKIELDINSIQNNELMSVCLWGATQNNLIEKSAKTINIPEHNEILKYLMFDYKYRIELIIPNYYLKDYKSLLTHYLDQYVNIKKILLNEQKIRFNTMMKSNPFRPMEDGSFTNNDWLDLYNHCIEIFCDNNSIGHKFILPDARYYKNACYLIYFLNTNSDTFKKSQLSTYKINLRKRLQRKKQNAQGIKTLEIKLNIKTVEKLKELQQYRNLTQSEIIEMLIKADYKKSLE